jgi:uncharacterized protein YjiS (DUF1127 family)
MDCAAGPKLHYLDRALPERRVLKLKGARGARVVCVAGDVWITEDGRYDDVVLAAGESAMLERDGMAMITPFGSADVEIVCPATTGLPGDTESLEGHLRAARRLRALALATLPAGVIAWVRGRGRDLLRAWAGRTRASHQTPALELLSDHLLRDIGLSRSSLAHFAGRVRVPGN